MDTITSTTQLDALFAQWALPFDTHAAAAHAPQMRQIELELRRRLARSDKEFTRWVDNQRPEVGTCAYQVLQRTISRASVNYGPVEVDACMAFCPVTIVLTTTHTELPKIDTELFRNTQPQKFMEEILANGLADDCNVSIDPVMYPLPRIADLEFSELPAIVSNMADVATLAKGIGDAHPSCIAHPNQGMPDAVSIAGGRVIGSLLIPLVFFSGDLGELPDVLNGKVPEENIEAFKQSASQALTVALGRWGPVRINFIVSAPALIFDALLESTSAHCDTAAYWASRAAIEAGGTECAIVYNDTPDEVGQGLSIGFSPGEDVECNFRVFAMSQAEIDTYTEAFAAGADAAGMTTINVVTHERSQSRLN